MTNAARQIQKMVTSAAIRLDREADVSVSVGVDHKFTKRRPRFS